MRKWERKNDYNQPWNKFKNKLPCVSSQSRSRWNIILCKHWIYFLNGNKKVWLALTDEQIPWNLYKDYFIMRNITRFVHQQTNYVLDVLLAKLGKSGSLNNHNQLIIKGSFLAKSNNADGQRCNKTFVFLRRSLRHFLHLSVVACHPTKGHSSSYFLSAERDIIA